MCRLYTLHTPRNILKSVFGVEFPEIEYPLFKTTHRVPAVRMRDGQKEVVLFRWGLIPPWAKDEKEGNSKVNARAETVATLNSFRTPLKKRRCLLVADGFYEYRDIGQKTKEPHLIEMADGSPFAFAGIWDTWRPTGEQPVESCSMITTEPNSLMAQIHDRMPVILPREVWGHWLSETEDVAELQPLLTSFPSELMRERVVESPLKRQATEGKPHQSASQSLF